VRLSLAAALVALTVPATASGAVCEGHADLSSVIPIVGDLDAPANTRVWIGEAWTDTAERLEVRRAVIPEEIIEIADITRIVAGRDEVTILHFGALLPHSAYRIFAIQDDGAEYELGVFATDEAADTTPPAVPGVDGFEPVWTTGEIPGCGLFADGQLFLEFTDDVLVLDIRDSDDAVPDGDDDDSADPFPLDLDPVALEGTVDGILFDRYHPEFFGIGNTPCLQNWPLAVEGATTEIRFGAFDLAGNFSGWGEWHELTVPRAIDPDLAGATPPPAATETGCSLRGSRASARAALCALALVALYGVRRRWHTPPP